MKILLASSEVEPFAKTGGLADVCGTLPRELRRLGHEVVVFLPAYRTVRRASVPITATDVQFAVPVGSKLVTGRLLESRLPDSDVVVYLVENEHYFDRDQLYGENGGDYSDNCERFVFFCRAVLEVIRLLDLEIDLIHANDWQTALLPAYLRCELDSTEPYENIASVLTIHNLAYQGRFWHWDMLLTGLDWKYFNWRQMEFFGQLNLLKSGIAFADAINTVSPTYALEIQTAEQGYGLEGALQHRAGVLSGILNGIDTQVWNPRVDPHLSMNYGVENWREGKAKNKATLQTQMGLRVDPKVPVIGIVGRMASQKGWSLILPVMQHWLETIDAQWVVLGTGQPEFESALASLRSAHAGKLGVSLEFSNPLAHLIEAGSDLFLMPSQYEPCGLNQMYSMAYGTVPVVRRTGGLADTVIDASETAIAQGVANGFSFNAFLPQALEQSLARAVWTYQSQPDVWAQLVENGMNADWSWGQSARQYAELYERTAVLFRAERQHV
ncbi:MAG: glycogen synthase GlgA [Pirellulaceae bacterium]|nr:glycogen synthase GlgA [Pirellulaceae bacterium]